VDRKAHDELQRISRRAVLSGDAAANASNRMESA
jgi:hypothetical protein